MFKSLRFFKFSLFAILAVITSCAIAVAFRKQISSLWSFAYPKLIGSAEMFVPCLVLLALIGIATLILSILLVQILILLGPLFGLHHLLGRLFGRGPAGVWFNNHGIRKFNSCQMLRAINCFSTAIRLQPEVSDYRVNRAEAYRSVERYDDAIAELQHALQLDSMNRRAILGRGLVYLETDQEKEALEDFSKLIDTEPNNAMGYVYRAYAFSELRRWRDAWDDLQKADELDESCGAKTQIARLQSCCPDESMRDGAAAVATAEQLCVESKWEDWIVVSILAAAYAECGKFELAISNAELALELCPPEEKEKRRERIELYKSGHPYRL